MNTLIRTCVMVPGILGRLSRLIGVNGYAFSYAVPSGLEVIKLEVSLKLEIKHNDYLRPQAANHCALF